MCHIFVSCPVKGILDISCLMLYFLQMLHASSRKSELFEYKKKSSFASVFELCNCTFIITVPYMCTFMAEWLLHHNVSTVVFFYIILYESGTLDISSTAL